MVYILVTVTQLQGLFSELVAKTCGLNLKP